MGAISQMGALPLDVRTAWRAEVLRRGDHVALSFLWSENDPSQPVLISIQFEEAVRLSARLRRAIAGGELGSSHP